MVIVLSDLHDPDAFSALQVLSQEHDCIVLHLQDPAELRVKGAGLFRGVEAESGRAFVGHGRRAWIDAGGWKGELTRFGIDYLHLRGLGTPAEGRAAAKAGKFDTLRTIFLAHLETPEARSELESLAEIIRSGRRVTSTSSTTSSPRRCTAFATPKTTGNAVQPSRICTASACSFKTKSIIIIRKLK
jgi:hypothetical protein